MGIQGMELCAMAVVVLLFIAVLKQFGILEPMSMEGNAWPSAGARSVWGGRSSRAPGSGSAGPASAALGHTALSGTCRLSRRPLQTPEGWPGVKRTKRTERPGARGAPEGMELRCLGWA